jgi:hypothetical protein
LRIGAIWAGGGLGLNYAWEMLQMPLYQGFEDGAGWRECFLAALGDVAILAVLYGAMALAARSGRWFERLSPGRVALLAAAGALAAVLVELQALAAGRWSYTPAMPRIPVLNVGWVPVLQMVVIPLALALASRRFRGPPSRVLGARGKPSADIPPGTLRSALKQAGLLRVSPRGPEATRRARPRPLLDQCERRSRRSVNRFGTICCRSRGYRRLVPDLRISGHWLQRAGFDRGQHYEIEVGSSRRSTMWLPFCRFK